MEATEVNDEPIVTQDEAKEQPTESETNLVTDSNEEPEKINWKIFREQYKKEKKAREELEQFVLNNLNTNTVQQKTQPQPEEKYDLPSDWLTGDDIRTWEEKVLEKKLEEKLEAKLRAKEEERARKDLPNRIRSSMQDFDQVCNDTNVTYLEQKHPEVAEALAAIPDEYKRWRAIYDYIKRVVPNNQAQADKAKAVSNQSKPQSASASVPQGTLQNGAPHQMTRQRRAELWAEMQRASRGQ